MNYFDKIENSEIVHKIIEISEKIEEEQENSNNNEKVITKLMFEQMLRGLYLQI